jgi:hypothetical protein
MMKRDHWGHWNLFAVVVILLLAASSLNGIAVEAASTKKPKAKKKAATPVPPPPPPPPSPPTPKLKLNYYAKTVCKNVESVVKAEVLKQSKQDFSIIPQLLRIYFHDCFADVRAFLHSLNRVKCIPQPISDLKNVQIFIRDCHISSEKIDSLEIKNLGRET